MGQFNLCMTSSPLLAKRPDSYTTSPLDNVLPAKRVVVSSIAEALKEYDAYADEVAKTGKPAALSAFKHPSCRGRKPPGFDKSFGSEPRFVNENLAPEFEGA